MKKKCGGWMRGLTFGCAVLEFEMTPSLILKCALCKNPFKAFACHMKRKNPRKYCSYKCHQISQRRKDSVTWRGVLYHVSNGYLVSSLTGLRLHRVKWELYRGEIPIGFVVHHKDRNKLNNALSNLELMEWGTHSSKHNHERHRIKRA